FCCQQAYQRRILSRTNLVPFIVTSRNTGISLTFEYTYVDAGAKFDYVEETTTTTTTTTTAEPLQTMEILDTVNMETDGLTTIMARVA
uniref:Glycoprotein B n=1 Tax=Haemonchus contortus TaxID=6289 RepID=A0A7I4XVJ6_HAECO